MCQVNPTVGDLEGNAALIGEWLARAESAGADLALFPELVLTGYPPEDLLLKPGFVARNTELADKIAVQSGECAAIFGFVEEGRDLHNGAVVCAGGEKVGTYCKQALPNYGVFDERRYFEPGVPAQHLYRIAGVNVGVAICEDAWLPAGPLLDQAGGGAELMVILNASPFSASKRLDVTRMVATRASDASCAIAYVNMVGGQDELVFDGGSFVLDSEGRCLAAADQFVEQLLVVDLELRASYRKKLLDPRGREPTAALGVLGVSERPRKLLEPVLPCASSLPAALPLTEEVYGALVLGTRDYVQKNGFSDVVVGMSGGVDSSLVAVVACDALGADRVHGVSMPSRYSSDHSSSDASEVASRLGIDYQVLPIEAAHSAFEEILAKPFSGTRVGLAEENLQSRIRGTLLMALSNKLGWMVLTTGNKSEMAVGYSTLYGDTAGGFAVLKDVPKTLVYELCRYRNAKEPLAEPLPESVLSKPPSAELRPDQRDDQSLPAYELLDPLLEAYVEEDRTAHELVSLGFEEDLVTKVVALVDRAEYKRRQSPPGIRVTSKAFGKDRRVPITNRYV